MTSFLNDFRRMSHINIIINKIFFIKSLNQLKYLE